MALRRLRQLICEKQPGLQSKSQASQRDPRLKTARTHARFYAVTQESMTTQNIGRRNFFQDKEDTKKERNRTKQHTAITNSNYLRYRQYPERLGQFTHLISLG